MNLKDFVQLVNHMRRTQQEYFATRSRGTLNRSKVLERQVDQALTSLSPGSDENYERDCKQLGEFFLTFDGERFEFASPIVPHPGVEASLQSLEVANHDNTSRYRILFKIEEV